MRRKKLEIRSTTVNLYENLGPNLSNFLNQPKDKLKTRK